LVPFFFLSRPNGLINLASIGKGLTKERVAELCGALRVNKNIRAIHLEGKILSLISPTAPQLFFAFPFFFFFLPGSQIGDDGAMEMAECLTVNNSLDSIYLGSKFFPFFFFFLLSLSPTLFLSQVIKLETSGQKRSPNLCRKTRISNRFTSKVRSEIHLTS
jgi:hypothetical protein